MIKCITAYSFAKIFPWNSEILLCACQLSLVELDAESKTSPWFTFEFWDRLESTGA